jgi:hypothetical protein
MQRLIDIVWVMVGMVAFYFFILVIFSLEV